jgi:hypothetical protein
MCGAATGGEREARWITSVESALNVSDGERDHLALMLTRSSAIAEVYAQESMAGSSEICGCGATPTVACWTLS